MRVVLVLLLLTAVSQFACAEPWQAPHMPWGEPDLQGGVEYINADWP